MPLLEFRRVLLDRKSTRLNSSHGSISYAVFCLKTTTDICADHFPPACDDATLRAKARRTTQACVCLGHFRLVRCESLIELCFAVFFFFNDTATTEIYTLSLHDALPILSASLAFLRRRRREGAAGAKS